MPFEKVATAEGASAINSPASEEGVANKSLSQRVSERLSKQYGGGRGWTYPHHFRRPQRVGTLSNLHLHNAAANDDPYYKASPNEKGQRRYINSLGQTIWKYEDVDTYLSNTKVAPRRLMVQAAPHVWKGNAADPSRTWRRTEIKGEVPLTLRMAEWALRPSERTSDEETEERGPRSALGVINTCFRVLIVSLPLQALLAFPGAGNPWDTDDVEDTYLDYPGYHWSWPKHAINPLDMSPGAPSAKNMPKFSVKKRAIRPRKLMVLRGEDFAEVLDPPADLQYLFISWKWDSFIRNDGSETASHGVARLKSMAAYATREAGLRAYWFDGLNQSISNERDSTSDQKQLLSQDVYSMSDIIRGSHHVALMLPNDDPKEMAGWGERIWTLPEGLLAPGNIDVWRWSDTGVHTKWSELSKVEMTHQKSGLTPKMIGTIRLLASLPSILREVLP